jgi:hypothetical protein
MILNCGKTGNLWGWYYHGGTPKPFKLIKRTGFGGHKVNYDVAQVNKVPFVIGPDFSESPVYFDPLFLGIVLDMPFKALHVDRTGDRGNHKEVSPMVDFPKIHNNDVFSAVIPEKVG